MKSLILLLLFWGVGAFAQTTLDSLRGPFVSRRADITLLTRQFGPDEAKLLELVRRSGAQIMEMSHDRERSSLTLSLLVDQAGFDSLARQLPEVTTVARNSINTTDLGDEMRSVVTAMDWVRLKLADTTLPDSLHAQERENLHALEIRKANLSRQASWHRFGITLSEDNPFQYSYDTDSWFSFINMPGVEARLLRVENPESGRTLETYRGFALRYMFTQGKSYVHLGVLKPSEKSQSDTAVTDIFFYDWGTDFYPRHLGKGKRRFLNLYSGFTVGGMLLNSTNDYDHTFTLGAHVGLELLKLQFFIWDVHGGYLFPLDTEWNKKLRGVDAGTALNFVF